MQTVEGNPFGGQVVMRTTTLSTWEKGFFDIEKTDARTKQKAAAQPAGNAGE